MKSVMKHLFSQIPRAEISRSVFDRSHGWKSTFDSGYLVPFLVDEVLPGDSYKVKFNFLARLSTPVVPTMDNLFLDTFYFFVPYRLPCGVSAPVEPVAEFWTTGLIITGLSEPPRYSGRWRRESGETTPKCERRISV